MDKMSIRGGKALKGKVSVSGSKNAALLILISALLSGEKCTFRRVPNLQDIRTIILLLSQMGVGVDEDLSKNQVTLHAKKLDSTEAPYDLVRKMRASVI